MIKRKLKPITVRDMASRRGLAIHKAKHGGWYINLIGTDIVLYATHEWQRVKRFLSGRAILVKRKEFVNPDDVEERP